MSFADRLPMEADEDWRYDIIAPENGLAEVLYEFAVALFRYKEAVFKNLDDPPDEPYIDLVIMHDRQEFLLRLIPNMDGLLQDEQQTEVFYIGEAFGILLDADGDETSSRLEVSGWLETATKTRGTIAGKLSVKRMSIDLRAEAS